jgi:hypothetical protein
MIYCARLFDTKRWVEDQADRRCSSDEWLDEIKQQAELAATGASEIFRIRRSGTIREKLFLTLRLTGRHAIQRLIGAERK